MLGYSVTFSKIPMLGDAMHYHSEKYHQRFSDPGLEIVYVKRGTIHGRLLGHEFKVEPNGILVLSRSLPFELFAENGDVQSHATIWLISDFKTELLEISARSYHEKSGIIVPMITPPSTENEAIMKRMHTIIANSDDINEHSRCAISAMSILDELASRARASVVENKTSILGYKIKKILLSRLDENITLDELAREFSKTPNYLNHVFRKENGVSIHQFLIRERLSRLCEMIAYENVSFADAAMSVGISDISYAYRLFKKHIGLTPSEFIESKKY